MAVVDSGIEAGHPALEGCVEVDAGIEVSVEADGSTVDHEGPHPDAFGHGTAVAGIIHSLAPEASITSVKVLGAGLGGKAAGFLRGLGWAVSQGFDVINLSLGTNRREWALAFYEVCDEAYFRNCFVVTAANNTFGVSFPSLYGSVTSVACNLTTDPVPVPLEPRSADGVPGPGHRRRRPVGRWWPPPHHRQLLRRAPHRRDRRPHPLEAPGAPAVPGEDGAVGDRRQRAGGAQARPHGRAAQPGRAHDDDHPRHVSPAPPEPDHAGRGPSRVRTEGTPRGSARRSNW